jgi:UDP-N-acetylmuramoylalanine--D-glutamate ligase
VKPRPPLPPGPYLVVGLARSGAAAARALRGHGEVLGVDSGLAELADGLRSEGLEVILGSDGVELLDRARTVVKSPGVPTEAPVVAEARRRGLEVVGELEVAWRLVPNEWIAVTGTNGKTTTVELLAAIHRAAGIDVAAAGNVGTAASSLAGALGPEAVVVAEASSFQLEDASEFAPECAVLLNVTPDHLDRHRTYERYREAKLRIFARQSHEGDVAVVPAGLLQPPGHARVVPFGGDGHDGPGLTLVDGELRFEGEPLMAASEIRLRGAHNLENAMAAAAAAIARGLPLEAVRDALRTFAGVPHRLEEVAEHGGVLFVNDSKATNVASALVGIQAFPGGVHAILGGSLKGGGFAPLREAVRSRCRACYLIGEAAGRLEQELEGAAPLHRFADMDGAVAAAAATARPGEVVLLSPACASFDQYRDFEDRGEHFRRLVGALVAA